MTPDDYCAEKLDGSNHYYGFLFLPEPARRAASAITVVAREILDIADEVRDPGVALTKVNWWNEELARTWSGTARHPATQALQPFVDTLKLPRERFAALLDAAATLMGRVRYVDTNRLDEDLTRLGAAEYSLPALAFNDGAGATPYRQSLDRALCMTRRLVDLGQDLRRDRIFLPTADLQRFGIAETDLLQRRHTPAFENLMAFEITQAHALYDQADQHRTGNGRVSDTTGVTLSRLGRTLLDEVGRSGYRVLEQRIVLTPIRRLWIAWRTASHEKRRTRRAA